MSSYFSRSTAAPPPKSTGKSALGGDSGFLTSSYGTTGKSYLTQSDRSTAFNEVPRATPLASLSAARAGTSVPGSYTSSLQTTGGSLTLPVSSAMSSLAHMQPISATSPLNFGNAATPTRGAGVPSPMNRFSNSFGTLPGLPRPGPGPNPQFREVPRPASSISRPTLPAMPQRDDIIKCGGKRLHFKEEDILIEKTGSMCCTEGERKKKIAWSNIQEVKVNFLNFPWPGQLTIKTRDKGEEHKYKIARSKIVQSSAAIDRRLSMQDKTTKTHYDALAAKMVKLLDGHKHVGIRRTGLLTATSRGMDCFSPPRVVKIAWGELVSTRLTRSCKGGTLSIHAIRNAAVDQGKVGTVDQADMKVDDPGYMTIRIKTSCAKSEALYDVVNTIMSDEYKHLEELEGVFIHNDSYSAKATKMGMFLNSTIGCFGGVTKAFIPWSTMVSLRYSPATSFKDCKLIISDRTEKPLNIGAVTRMDYEMLVKAIADVALNNNVQQPSEEQDLKNGVVLKGDGFHQVIKKCCRTEEVFVPWPMVDAIVLKRSCCSCFGGTLHILTEAGEYHRVMKTTKARQLWNAYSAVRAMKFGEQLSVPSLTFNTNLQEEGLSCMLSQKSLRLCSKKVVTEFDLERVIKPARGKTNKDLLVSVGIAHGRKTSCGKTFATKLIKSDDGADVLAQKITQACSLRIAEMSSKVASN
eukprot:NODE_1716_length_2395_cov_15.003527.p1 GENE.NODE_1716_length_2395_cov_15.003527~~NODE_1716_length_2395_cov_15.003527.p1  ORF type:complete len:692 (+),score=148.77 NODE_1716_length_2395_cov_15.003527:121-2196(+)